MEYKNINTANGESYIYSNKYKLGKGGFGEVYSAWDISPKHIKRILPYDYKRSNNLNTIEGWDISDNTSIAIKKIAKKNPAGINLNNEPWILNKLSCVESKIICYKHHINTENNIYILMDKLSSEYVSLAHFILHEKVLRVDNLTTIIRDILNAINYIHSCNILHLDISPNNIMINKNRHDIVIIDFGLSCPLTTSNKKISACSSYTESIGTINYISPEMAELSNTSTSKLGPWSDIFSCGLVIYFILSGGLSRQNIINKFYDQSLKITSFKKLNEYNIYNYDLSIGILPEYKKDIKKLIPTLNNMIKYDLKKRPKINSIFPKLTTVYDNYYKKYLPIFSLNDSFISSIVNSSGKRK